ncbi:MAG: YihY/virulence factor BrkB family protein [Bacteroidia bacterium]
MKKPQVAPTRGMLRLLRRTIRRSIIEFLLLLRSIRLPGFQKMGLYDVLRFFFHGLLDAKFTLLASAMAYQFFFSLFPTLLLIYATLPFFPLEGLQGYMLQFLGAFFPAESLGLINTPELVARMLERSPSIGLLLLSVGLVLWGATRGIIAMMKAFTKREEVFKRRSLFELYGTALLIFVSLGVIFLLATTLQLLADAGLRALVREGWMSVAWRFYLGRGWQSLLTLATIFISISVLYYLAPATRQRWKFFSPGSVTAGLLTMIAIVGLKYYFVNFANFDRIYGSLGAIILLMVWFYYLSIMLLIGFELNAAIDMASHREQEESHE